MEKKYICNVSTEEAPLVAPVMFAPVVNRVSSARITRQTLEGREHFVVPMVMLTEGVHNGSQGAIYYPPEVIKNSTNLWDGKPIVVYHPKLFVSPMAGDPKIFNNQKIGTVFNTSFDGRQLLAEAWIDMKRVGIVDLRVLTAIQNRQMMEISTGVFIQSNTENGTFNGKDYELIADHLTPDHLAILPDQSGSCSIADGCGLVRNESDDEHLVMPKMFEDQDPSTTPTDDDDEHLVMPPLFKDPSTTPTDDDDEHLVAPTMKFD